MIFYGYLTRINKVKGDLIELLTCSGPVFVGCEDPVVSAFPSFSAKIHHLGKNSPAANNQPKTIDLNRPPNFVADYMASIRCLMAES